MKKIAVSLLALLISFSITTSKAQEHDSNKSMAHHVHHNDLAAFFGATYIFESGFVLPTFGIEYVRKINPHFGVGFISEIELGSHIISMDEISHEEAELIRESALLILPALYFQTGNFITSVGYGVELEKNENLGLFKLTAMYVLKLKQDTWFVVPSVSWDYTTKFNGLVYGFNIAKAF